MDLRVLTKGDSDLELDRSHSNAGHTAVSLRAWILILNAKSRHPNVPRDSLKAQALLPETELGSLHKEVTLNDWLL